jgi:hypothetical protein
LPSHENKYIPRREGEMNLKNLLHGTVHIIITGRLGVESLDWEGMIRNCKAESTSVEFGKLQRY